MDTMQFQFQGFKKIVFSVAVISVGLLSAQDSLARTKARVQTGSQPQTNGAAIFEDLGLPSAARTAMNIASLVPNRPIMMPLSYYPSSGFYITNLRVNGQVLPVVIDTGSSNTVVVGSPNACPTCAANMNYPKTALTVRNSKFLTPPLTAGYGSGWGTFSYYPAQIQFSAQHTLDTPVGVWLAGKNMGNIMGMAYPFIRVPLTASIFQKSIQDFNLQNVFTLHLCGAQGRSYLEMGGIPAEVQQQKIQYSLITHKGYYQVQVKGIYAPQSDQWVAQLNPQSFFSQGIMDSGTTKTLVFPAPVVKKVVSYVQSKIPQSLSRQLPMAFWSATRCIHFTAQQIAAFPPLQIALAKLGDNNNRSIYLNLPPQHYIRPCGEPGKPGFYFFSFVANSARQANSGFAIILGAPLMEGYDVMFYPGNMNCLPNHDNARIGFFPSSCQP